MKDLHAQLVESRDDLALWTVYGDQLQAANDPRGALIAMMLERERAPSRALFEAEYAYRAKHARALLPRGLHKAADTIAWRRGFAQGIPVASPEVLREVLGSPMTSFVEAVSLHVTADDWDDWFAALEGVTLPWRRMKMELSGFADPVELAAWLAHVPQLEHLHIRCFADDETHLELGDVEAPALRCLVLEAVAAVSGLEDAAIAQLEELRLYDSLPIGDAVFESELWSDLKRVVSTQEVPGGGPEILRHRREELEDDYYDDNDEEPQEDAIIAISALVDASVIHDAARSLRGFASLAVDVGHVVDASMTALRLRGHGPEELAPFGFATTLAHALPPETRIALVHASSKTSTSRGLTLSARPLQRTAPGGFRLMRTLLDHELGRDPGLFAAADLWDALRFGPTLAIVGSPTPRTPVLVDIDPQSMGPMPEIDEDFEEPIPEHQVELYTPGPEQVMLAAATAPAEAPPLEETVEELEEELYEESEEAGDETGEIALGTDASPDGAFAWTRLLSDWAEREANPDDELAERFADPEEQYNEAESQALETAVSPDSACASCTTIGVPLRPCVWCGGHFCEGCSIRPSSGAIWCTDCVEEAATEREEALRTPPTYDDEVYDDEVAEDVAEAKAPVIDDGSPYDEDEYA